MPLNLYKKIGETPLMRLDRLRKEKPEYEKTELTYAGRLDPIAEGVLLVLTGEECKEKRKYLGLPKKYECEILWGFDTDTYDILGRIQKKSHLKVDQEKVEKIIAKLQGAFTQSYPPYSSKPVRGKPLFLWAREGLIDTLGELPSQRIEITQTAFLGNREIVGVDLLQIITEKIKAVTGDFRQPEITKDWQDALETNVNSFIITRFTVNCSSGTYVRGLAHSMGKILGCGGIVLSLKRLEVGEMSISEAI